MNITARNAHLAFKRILEDAPNWELVQDGGLFETVNASITIDDPTDRLVILDTDWSGFEPYLAAQWAWYSWMHQIPLIKLCWPAVWSRFESPVASGCKSNYGMYVWQEGQFMHCLELLRKDPQSRRAVIMFNRPEAALAKDVIDSICTTSLQFILRNDKLHAIVTMRSNEVFFNFRTDTVFFTMLQELAASMLGVHVGTYCHNVGSFHVKPSDVRPVTIVPTVWPRFSAGELDDLLALRSFFTTRNIRKSEFSLTLKLTELLKFYGSIVNTGA